MRRLIVVVVVALVFAGAARGAVPNPEARAFFVVNASNGEVLAARNGLGLRASLDSIYRGRILAESMNAGETLADTLSPNASRTSDSARSPSPPSRRRKPSQ